MTPSENSPTPSQLTITRKRRSPSLSSAPSLLSAHKRSCPTRKPPQNFWVAGEREIPCYRSNPWDFYTSFVKCESDPDLVLCNSSIEIQVITPYYLAFNSSTGSCLPHIQHQNFINIYEIYYFEDRVFAISEYFDFSLEDLLLHSIYPTKSEIAYIINQVRHLLFFATHVLIQIGSGRYAVSLVKKARPSAHFNTEYSTLSKWECQN
jgi:hypothetical protein